MKQRDDLIPGQLMGDIPVTLLQSMHTHMVRIREFEERAADLVESKEIRCPCHLYIGQEAVAAGVCAALRTDDYIFGTHRSHGHYLAKGGDMNALMAELFGKETGCSRGRGGSMHLIQEDVGILGVVPIVSGTIPLAVGAALAAKLRGEDRVSVAFFGDGAMEEGTAHEALNLAAHRKLPVIFVCENNLYASHLPLLDRRAEDNLHRAGEAHGLTGLRVDGNDVATVYRAAAEAAAGARSGEGPTLLECRTYRWRGHVGPSWDLDVGVKRKDELNEWMDKDPIERLRLQLIEIGVEPEELERVSADARQEVAGSIEFARQSPYPDANDVMKYVFTE